jgi:hypothetical protein
MSSTSRGSRPSSISQSGLGSLGGLCLGFEGPATTSTFSSSSLSLFESDLPLAAAVLLVLAAAWLGCIWEAERRVVVALFLNGLSNAFLRFLTLTCPNPGRFWSWSEVARDMLAKL